MTECPIPPDTMSSLGKAIGHLCHIDTDTGVLLNHQEPQEIKNERSAKENLDSGALDSNSIGSSSSQQAATVSQQSWHGFEDTNGYALRNEPKEGTLIRNPHTGEITEYEK